MKWLMTQATKSDANTNYERWLRSAEVEFAISRAGDETRLNPSDYHALLLTGGGDVDPALYGETVDAHTMYVDAQRDRHEIELIRMFLAARVPVFGICRGIQVLNVALGGGLIQHIPGLPNLAGEKHRESRRDAVHRIVFTEPSALRDAWRGCGEVNSSHHQAVDPERLGKGLAVLAKSEGGIIEAVEGRGVCTPVLAVQWHPERMDEARFPVRGLMDLMKQLATRRR